MSRRRYWYWEVISYKWLVCTLFVLAVNCWRCNNGFVDQRFRITLLGVGQLVSVIANLTLISGEMRFHLSYPWVITGLRLLVVVVWRATLSHSWHIGSIIVVSSCLWMDWTLNGQSHLSIGGDICWSMNWWRNLFLISNHGYTFGRSPIVWSCSPNVLVGIRWSFLLLLYSGRGFSLWRRDGIRIVMDGVCNIYACCGSCWGAFHSYWYERVGSLQGIRKEEDVRSDGGVCFSQSFFVWGIVMGPRLLYD